MILFLKPYFESKPWAGEELNNYYDCPSGTGEAWLVSGFKGKSSIILNSIYEGKTLRWLWANRPELFGNMKDREFPLLIKAISAKENLSVQVHPNDDYAIKKHNQLGKSECWYILNNNKAETATVGVNVKNVIELKDAINHNMLENYLIQLPIKKHDLIAVEPGTVHAMNAGSYVLEIQESSDLTYRLYDYNREPKRELHLEDSYNVIDYNNNKKRIFNLDDENFENKYFKVIKHRVNGIKKFEINGFSIFSVLNGNGTFGKYRVKGGDTFMATNDTKEFEMSGNFSLLEILPIPNSVDRLKKTKPVALVTGLLNQDGYYMTKFLLEKNYKVYGVCYKSSDYEKSPAKEFEKNKNFEVIFGDLIQTEDVSKILERVRPDEIYHYGSQSNVGESFNNPEFTTQVNSLGTLRLLEGIKKGEVRTKLFNFSTPYLFSGNEYPQTEKTLFEPKSPYAISKLYAHEMVKSYRENFSIYAVNGICYNHESKLKGSGFVSTKIINAAKAISKGEQDILELGNLDAFREWGHIDDYVNAMWLTLQQPYANDYIISSGIACNVREFTTAVFAKVGISLKWIGEGIEEVGIDTKTNKVIVKVNPKFLRPNDAKILVGDSTFFKKTTGYQFKYYCLNSLLDSLMEE